MTTESKRGDIFKIALSTVQNTSTQYEQDIDGLDDLPHEFEQVN